MKGIFNEKKWFLVENFSFFKFSSKNLSGLISTNLNLTIILCSMKMSLVGNFYLLKKWAFSQPSLLMPLYVRKIMWKGLSLFFPLVPLQFTLQSGKKEKASRENFPCFEIINNEVWAEREEKKFNLIVLLNTACL